MRVNLFVLIAETCGATTLVAKEYLVYNNPRVLPDDLGEEMVRMLVRLARHLRRT